MRTDLSECAELYETLGFCVYGDQLVTDDRLVRWANTLANFDKFIHNDAVGSMGERGDYLVTDGPTTFQILDGLPELYEHCKGIMAAITGSPVISSPYPLSAVNAKVYGNSGCQGLHYDTQPTTCLLFVTHGSPLEVQLLNGEWVEVDPVPGCIAVFQGRKCAHRVPPVEKQFRVTVPMNYYYEDDQYRPEWIDDAIYGNKDYVSA